MAMTRANIRDFAKLMVGEYGYDKLKEAVINQFINLSLRKVQQDLMKLGVKTFVKEAHLSGFIASLPEDAMAMPNAVVDVKASVSSKSSAILIIGNVVAQARFTVATPGANNQWTIEITNGVALAISVLNYTSRILTITINTGVTTVQQLLDLLNTNLIFRKHFEELTLLNGVGVELAVTTPSTNTNNVTGDGWQPVTEVSIEDFDEIDKNTYKVPTPTNIIYKRDSFLFSSPTLTFKPNTVLYSNVMYYYRLPDLTTDSDTSNLPEEYEELLLLDVARKCCLRVSSLESSLEKKQAYNSQVSELKVSYDQLLEQRAEDKARLLTETPKD